jgi:hypothetical protein
MGDGKTTQHDGASEFGQLKAFRCRLEGLQRVKAVNTSENNQDQGAILLVPFLHERKHQAADFTEGVLFMEVENLGSTRLWELDDVPHA